MRGLRLRLRHGVVAMAAGLLVTTGLSVMSSDAAEELRAQVVVVEAPRGRILDREGKVLVEDGLVAEVAVDPAGLAGLPAAERQVVADRLTEALLADRVEALAADPASVRGAVPGAPPGSPFPLDPVDVWSRLADADADEPVTVVFGASDALVARLRAAPEDFPGVVVTEEPARRYPYGALAAHVLGYVAAPSQYDEGLPEAASVVGRAGVERTWDTDLRGRPGRIVYEVDDQGRPVRELTDRRVEPQPGRDVYLTIDIDVQYALEQALATEVQGRRGVVDGGCPTSAEGCDPPGAAGVVLDPRDGAVLALASYPTYDPALFAGGISAREYQALTPEAGDAPMFDRATTGQYAPAATIKPFTAHAALAAGLVAPGETYQDTGVHLYDPDCDVSTLPSRCAAQNRGATAHGAVDLRAALAVSSDTYWYRLGDQAWQHRDAIGEEALQDGLAAWGFGRETGVDLGHEAAGRVPTPAWLVEFSRALNGDTELGREAGTWRTGTSGNLAVGQGDLLVTPLQLASAYGGLARSGERFVPRVVLRVTDHASPDGRVVTEPEPAPPVAVEPGWGAALLGGLADATTASYGTARAVFGGFDQTACPVAGKTGTAQVAGKDDTSLFAAVAPAPSPGQEARLAVAVVVEGAGFGASAAGPAVRRVLDATGCDPAAAPTAPLGGWFTVDPSEL